MKMKKVNWKSLIISLAISLGAGVISALLTSNSMEIYEKLYQPPLAPPGWLFPIVWMILFILMGVSAYFVYESNKEKEEKDSALLLYGIQLVVNVVWSILFFRFHGYFFAFLWLLLLWYLIYHTLKRFYDIEPIAGWLMVPYLMWVTFAGYLNLVIAIREMF
ncbi:MAG: TspO/MBR family protein [Anaerostipes sp.]